MKIFVMGACKHKIYLATQVQCRSQLPQSFYIKCPVCGNSQLYYSYMVDAEAEEGAAVGGAAIGGLIGLLGGPLGLIVGGTIGGLLGASSEDDERKRVNRFLRC